MRILFFPCRNTSNAFFLELAEEMFNYLLALKQIEFCYEIANLQYILKLSEE